MPSTTRGSKAKLKAREAANNQHPSSVGLNQRSDPVDTLRPWHSSILTQEAMRVATENTPTSYTTNSSPLSLACPKVMGAIMSSSYYRDNVQVRTLTKTMRNREEPSFSSMVDNIGDGLPLPDSDGLVDIPGVHAEVDLQTSLDYVFPSDILADPVSYSKHCVVTLHNDNVDIINDLVLSRVPGELHTLEGRTILNLELLECELDDAFAMTDSLSTLQHSGVPSHIIKLKVGVCVMLIRNLDVSAGLTNGAKVVVKGILPYAEQVSTWKDGTVHWIPRISFSFITWQGVDVKRVQCPVRLCVAMTVTVNKAKRWNGSFLIYAGMSSCTDAGMSAYPELGIPPTSEF